MVWWYVDRIGDFLLHDKARRLWICVYWITSLMVVLPLSQMVTSRYPQSFLPQICTRKIFHLLCVVMFAPIIELDIHMMALSLGVATCGLLIVEYVRYVSKQPYLVNGTLMISKLLLHIYMPLSFFCMYIGHGVITLTLVVVVETTFKILTCQ